MAENEIQILIKAIDESSETLKRIDKNMQNMSKNSQQSNQSLGQSFKAVQGAMLNLGQAAQGIHNIFEISQNRTRQLENAQDRLENSTLRLKQSINDLRDAKRKLTDIEEKHERDTLNVERAQLRLKDAQIELKKYTDRLALGVKFGAEKQRDYEEALLDAKEAEFDLIDAQKEGIRKTQELTDATQDIKDKEDAVTIANNNTERAQRQLNKTISDAKWMYVDMSMQALSAAGNIGTFLTVISDTSAIRGASTAVGGLTGTFGGLTSAIGIGGLAATLGTAGAMVGFWMLLNALKTDPLQDEIKELTSQFDFLTNSANEADKAIGKALSHQAELEATMRAMNSGYIGTGTSRDLAPTGNFTIPYKAPSVLRQRGDFISRPGQGAVNFSPDDTIIGTKGGIGTTIIIEGNNIYGTDPDDISDAILNKLRKKITI